MRLRLTTIVTVFALALLSAPLTGGPVVAQDTVAVGDSAARRPGGSAQAAPADTIVTQQPGDTAVSPLTEQEGEEPEAAPGGFIATADRYVGYFNTALATVFFWDVMFWDDDATFPLVVLWLVFGATFLTLKMGFINFRAFKHAVNVTRGKYSNPADAGEVSHFQALSAALSATVGLGNIAGVAIAVSIGGPGATFWMILAGLLGMSSKFTECTLGQQYRQVRPDGRLMGGAMYYLSKGLADLNMPRFGKVLAVVFAVLCIGGSFGGGNMFQVNQSMNALQETVPLLGTYPWVYGVIMVLLTGIVIIGGIRRIATVADKIVPFMCGIYVLTALAVIIDNAPAIPGAFGAIIDGAFSPGAAYGGFIGVLVQGFRRAAFSNEAGAGSAAIAHSAARTPYPVREGIVALLEPFIDTVVVCTMTALVIVITGAYANPEYSQLIADNQGAALTSRAFGEHITWFPLVLSLAVMLFAYSTMISWSYYGERCWVWMFGDGTTRVYQALFLVFTFLGSIVTAANVLEFGDLMILGMAFPNLIGVLLLSGKVKRELEAYWARYKAGEFPVYK